MKTLTKALAEMAKSEKEKEALRGTSPNVPATAAPVQVAPPPVPKPVIFEGLNPLHLDPSRNLGPITQGSSPVSLSSPIVFTQLSPGIPPSAKRLPATPRPKRFTQALGTSPVKTKRARISPSNPSMGPRQSTSLHTSPSSSTPTPSPPTTPCPPPGPRQSLGQGAGSVLFMSTGRCVQKRDVSGKFTNCR